MLFDMVPCNTPELRPGIEERLEVRVGQSVTYMWLAAWYSPEGNCRARNHYMVARALRLHLPIRLRCGVVLSTGPPLVVFRADRVRVAFRGAPIPFWMGEEALRLSMGGNYYRGVQLEMPS